MSMFQKEKNNVSTTTQPSDANVASSEKPIITEQELKQEHPLTEIVRFALIALIIVLPIRWFVAQPFIVSGASMENTFHGGEYLIVDQISYYFEDPQRGEVVVFRYPRDPSKFFIKRVIGVPGDTVNIEGNIITITNEDHPEGFVISEPYVFEMTPNTNIEETLRENEYYVMGDNRNASSDSRVWGILSRDKIVGRAFLRLFPISKLGVFPGMYENETTILDGSAN